MVHAILGIRASLMAARTREGTSKGRSDVDCVWRGSRWEGVQPCWHRAMSRLNGHMRGLWVAWVGHYRGFKPYPR